MPKSFFEGKQVLVIGGLGFIGSSIAQRLVPQGAKVTIFDACLNPYGWNFANIKEISGKAKFVKGDTRNREGIAGAVAGADVVFDCAAQVSHSISVEKPFLDIDINCTGAMNILEALRGSKNDPVVVYAGTRGEIGQMKYCPIDEAHPTDPVDINGINKLAAEKYYLLYHKLYGLKSSSVRINNAYGERCQVRHADYGIVNYFLRLALEGKDLTVYGDGAQTKDYCHVSDVVDAMLLAASNRKAYGEFFMLGSNKGTSFSDMCNAIITAAKSVSKTKSKINYVPWAGGRKSIEIWDFVVSYNKINKLLGWKPKTATDEGLRMTAEFYNARREDYF